MSLVLNNPFTSEVSQCLPYYKQMEIKRKTMKDRTDKSYIDQLKGTKQYMIPMHVKNCNLDLFFLRVALQKLGFQSTLFTFPALNINVSLGSNCSSFMLAYLQDPQKHKKKNEFCLLKNKDMIWAFPTEEWKEKMKC